MTTSGTYNFDPAIGELVLNAFARLRVRRAEILQEHMENARFESNFLTIEWANRGVNLWTVDLITVPLIQGQATYSVPPETVMMLDAYIVTTSGGSTFNRMIFPFSRTEFASLPQPNTQAPPTVFWFDRLVAPTFTLWPVPDGNATYTMSYYRYRRIQDAGYAAGQTLDVIWRWLDAFAAALAHRLSRMYAPELEQVRAADAEKAWTIAATQDVENVPMYIYPGLSSYFRN